jgi:pSer/pThr/pTyr-binding forkhead associated (FHA) protein
VAFTLRVSQGSDEPELLSFDGGEVRLGRTADNDVVIKDPASSRSHARVYEEDGRFFVEDLKSANGTTLNEKPLSAPMPLKAGDKIAIGDVVLEFSQGGPSSTLDSEDDEAPAPPPRPSSKPAAPAVSRAARKPTGELGKQALEVTAPKGKAMVQRPPSRALPATEPPSDLADKTDDSAPVPSAADRARERRELQRSSMGRVQLLWNELPKPTRIVVGIVGVLALVGILGALVNAVIPKRVVRRAEPAELVPNGDPIAESFGEGDTDYSRPDMKSFTFAYASPTAIVGVLHYQARDCSKDEVSIELNGVQVGTVPPDTIETDSRQLEVVLPSGSLKLNEPNEVVFDNVGNPPASDPWRIWNVWVEVIPVPKLSAEQAANRARDNFQRAGRLYDLREVGSMNLFRAWKEYRDAWLMLEATEDRNEELLQTARSRMREIRPMLDKKCAGILMSYQREASQKDPDIAAARMILQQVYSNFEKEHPCYGISRGLMAQLEDLSVLQ